MGRRIHLIAWNDGEAEAGAARLRTAGYDVTADRMSLELLRRLRVDPPDAFVIDLSHRPSQGRDAALALRQSPATRNRPLIFAGGDPDKTAGIGRLLPGAVFVDWNRIRSGLRKAIAHPPEVPAAAPSVLAGYSGVPLPKKLGIGPGSRVCLVGAPSDFDRTLGRLPEGATVRRGGRGSRDLTLWFVTARKDLERGIRRALPWAERGRLWIVWPKKSSRLAADISEREVREVGLSAGLVDYKICAVDATWSGLKFSRRSEGKAARRES